MINNGSIFGQAIYVISRNPILFLMPLIGLIISVTTEAIFVIGLSNNNNPNYFPFINLFVLGLFFIAFAITYVQLVITRSIILKKRLRIKDPCHIEIFVLFIIYSIYMLIVVQMGGYEGDIRKNYVIDSDRFSLYTVKLKSYSDIIAIIPAGIVIILFSTIFSVLFNSWMVMSMCRYHKMRINDLYYTLKDFINIITKREEVKRHRMGSLFLLTLIISGIGFIVTNIAILPIANILNLYLIQYVIVNIIGTLYSPFFLICLFLILSPRIHA
ncbi:MAG TPA: hypothetical protein VF220_05990 [Nitrososphaeraceae archaeon]